MFFFANFCYFHVDMVHHVTSLNPETKMTLVRSIQWHCLCTKNSLAEHSDIVTPHNQSKQRNELTVISQQYDILKRLIEIVGRNNYNITVNSKNN